MANRNISAEEIEKKYLKKDLKKKKKMKVSGKGVFQLKKLLNKKASKAQLTTSKPYPATKTSTRPAKG